MKVYQYHDFVSTDKEKLEERIFDQVAENIKNISTVESTVEYACEDIEEIEMSQAEYNSCKGRI